LTAGASGFLLLIQSGERPEAATPLNKGLMGAERTATRNKPTGVYCDGKPFARCSARLAKRP
jgi:hypothetical protein